VVAVVASGEVPLRAETLDPELFAPALEGEGAALNAPDGWGSRDQGDFGVADRGVAVG